MKCEWKEDVKTCNGELSDIESKQDVQAVDMLSFVIGFIDDKQGAKILYITNSVRQNKTQ